MTEIPPGKRRWLPLWMYAAIALGPIGVIGGGIAFWNFADRGGCSAATPAIFGHIYNVPSSAMQPTLMPGEWVWAERRYYCDHDPRRGDLAVFVDPKSRGVLFIKRIVGLPGDRVQLTSGQLRINGEPVARQWLESAIHSEVSGDTREHSRFVESFAEGTPYTIEIGDQAAPNENTEEVAVPDGQYFMLGDNRDNSADSRMPMGFGLVPRAFIADRPAMVVWGEVWDRVGLRLR
jgi:signal peptidase I